MIPVLILSACGLGAPVVPEQLPDLQIRETPTLVVDTTAATQSTELERPFVPVTASFDVRLTAVSSSAKVIRSGGNELEVQQDQMVDVQVDEGIEVVKLEEQDEQSYSILDFADDLEVELFSNTSVFLADLRQGAGSSTHVTLHLNGGHLFVHLNDQTTSEITVQTLYATIKTLTDDAEFDVCHNEELTCVLVKKGVVEVNAQNRKGFLVKAGESVYFLKDQPPSAIICVPISRFIDWEESFRQFADTPPLEKEISELPQERCPLTATGLPINARILYQDEFRNPFSGWDRGRIDNFVVRYAGLQYYRVQAQDVENQFITSVPSEREYGDVNIDLRANGEAESGGDFRYGLVFRRSGEQYYAFIISPVAKTWHFLKSSSAGLETLREGTDERMRGLDTKETLRVETYGSTFLVFINDRFIDQISDPDYASGEVGLFVETIDSLDAIIRFDSLIIWDMQPAVPNPNQGGREYCFNTWDDDDDRLIDRADPDCQRLGRTATPLPQPTNTSISPNTSTPQPINTSVSQPTNTSVSQPTNTSVPQPTNTSIPPKTSTPGPTSTRRPTRTPTSPPTNPPPTATNPPPPTATNPPPPTVQPTDPPPPTVQPTDPPPPTVQPTDPPPPTEPVPTEPPIEPTP